MNKKREETARQDHEEQQAGENRIMSAFEAGAAGGLEGENSHFTSETESRTYPANYARPEICCT